MLDLSEKLGQHPRRQRWRKLGRRNNDADGILLANNTTLDHAGQFTETLLKRGFGLSLGLDSARVPSGSFPDALLLTTSWNTISWLTPPSNVGV